MSDQPDPPAGIDSSANEDAGLDRMLGELRAATGSEFAEYAPRFASFMTGVESGVQESDFFDAILDIHSKLSDQHIVGGIRSVDSWANGEQNFRIVPKSWPSVIDKLYRINIEENRLFSSPPLVPTVSQRVLKADATLQRWITPEIAHEVADDLVRTKFVVPFADGVVEVSDQITTAIDKLGLQRFKRFHAKDSGYHARHHYVLLTVPGFDGSDISIALEIKVLTKLQDTLGELTHLLYEKQRQGLDRPAPKRKVAWLFESPEFLASYVGHAGHFIEASIIDLKNRILELEGD